MNTDEHGLGNRGIDRTRQARDCSIDPFTPTQQPEGLLEIRRELSAAIPPEPMVHNGCTLEGCQTQSHSIVPGRSLYVSSGTLPGCRRLVWPATGGVVAALLNPRLKSASP